MEIISEILQQLDRFREWQAHVHEYSRFGAILRLRVENPSDEVWIISFTDCLEMKFPVRRHPFRPTVTAPGNGYMRVSDAAGFDVIFKQCFLIHEDEYLAD